MLDLYQQPQDPQYPLVCMDESNKQLVSDRRPPLPSAPGQPARVDYEYEHHGVNNLFLFFEPLRGWRHVEVTDHRTATDWARAMQWLADVVHPEAQRIKVVLDNLNTHGPGSFYETFEPAEAKRLAERFEFHYTPKHGSWLNMAEIEFSALMRRLEQRLPDKATLVAQVAAWEAERNHKSVTVDWRFTTVDARIKLKRLYPLILV